MLDTQSELWVFGGEETRHSLAIVVYQLLRMLPG